LQNKKQIYRSIYRSHWN